MKKKSINFTVLYKKYPGKWVALGNDEKTVLASANTAKQVVAKSNKKGYKAPILYRVPSRISFSLSYSRSFS